MAKGGTGARRAFGTACTGAGGGIGLAAALCLTMAADAALAQTSALRPKPRPAVEATAPAATDVTDLPGEADGAPTDDGTAAPAVDGASPPDSDAAPTATTAAPTDAPALAAPAAANAPAAAPKDAKPKPPPRDPNRGSVTNLPLPRYVSLKGKEGNARRGPGLTHRIDWVFVRAGMPLRITGEYENWRRIEDSEGAGGWVHYSLLSGVRSAQVAVDMAEFHDTPDDDAAVSFKAEKDVIGWIQECVPDWCRLSIDGEKGWVRKTALWGVDPGEIVE
mgnify:CR=1 FL=1